MQVDETQRQRHASYDIVISCDLMNTLDITIDYAENKVSIGKGDQKCYILMKELGMLKDMEAYQLLYDLHVKTPILKQ